MHFGTEHLRGDVQTGLGVFYLVAVVLNLGCAIYWLRRRNAVQGGVWTVVAGIFLIHAVLYLLHVGPILPRGIRDNTTWLMGLYRGQMGPILYVTLATVGFILLLRFRRFFTDPIVAWALLDVSLIAAGWAMTDENFRAIVTKPDNVPITMLIYTVGFFTWVGLRQAVINDDRMARGEPPLEKLEDDKVLVWPDLVYTELICMVVVTFLLVIWATALKA